MLHQAREDIKLHPSKALDHGRAERTAKHYLTRVVNKLGGTVEVSSHMATAAIMGMPAETCFHSFQGVYIDPALVFANNQNENLNHADSEENLNHCVNQIIEEDHVVEETQNQDESQLTEEVTHATATIYKSKEGPVAVMQHIHYAYRGPELAGLSLYEYAALIQIISKQATKATDTNDPRPLNIDEITKEPESGVSSHNPIVDGNIHPRQEKNKKEKSGRPPNKTFEFLPDHPLENTHVQRLNSKTKIPTIFGRIPNDESEITETWEKNTDSFARYILCLSRPWFQTWSISRPHQP